MENQNQIPIQIEKVSRIYQDGDSKVYAVNQVDLEIQRGEFTVLSGPSGSGKTTLLNLMGGLDRPDEGKVIVAGEQTNSLSDAELTRLRLYKIGFIFQAYNLLPVLTVYENIQLILQVQEVPLKQHKDQIFYLLEELGLSGLEDRFPSQLSGGQQQRVAVARSMIGNPSLVLADEPTANLDSESSLKLLELMRKLNESEGVTFVFSSHDEMVVEMARRVVHLRDGKVSGIENR